MEARTERLPHWRGNQDDTAADDSRTVNRGHHLLSDEIGILLPVNEQLQDLAILVVGLLGMVMMEKAFGGAILQETHDLGMVVVRHREVQECHQKREDDAHTVDFSLPSHFVC